MSDMEKKVSELQQRNEELLKLVKINGIINTTLDIGKLLKLIMEVIKDIMNTEASSMLLYDEESHVLVFKVAIGDVENKLVEKYRLKQGQGIAGWVAENRKIAYVNDVYSDERFDDSVDKKTGFTTRSLVCAPLLFKGKLLGVIQAINPMEKEGFNDHDLELFSVFADQASLAVQNAIFFQNALDEARMKSEIQAAQAIHDTSLTPVEIKDNHTVFTARSIQSRVSGVFHGALQKEEQLIFYNGDVHLTGVPGALRAARLGGILRGIFGGHDSSSWEYMPARIEHELQKENLNDEMTSLFAGSYCRSEKVCRFIYTGEMYPFVVTGKRVKYIKGGSFVIGEGNIRMISALLEKGDFFIVLSPRFMRVRDHHGKRIPFMTVARSLKSGSTVEEKYSSLFETVSTYSSFWKRSDFTLSIFQAG